MRLELIPNLQHQHIIFQALTPLVWSFVILSCTLTSWQSTSLQRQAAHRSVEKPPGQAPAACRNTARFQVNFWLVKSAEYFEKWKALVSVYYFSGVLVKKLWPVEAASDGVTSKTNNTREQIQCRQWPYILTELPHHYWMGHLIPSFLVTCPGRIWTFWTCPEFPDLQQTKWDSSSINNIPRQKRGAGLDKCQRFGNPRQVATE